MTGYERMRRALTRSMFSRPRGLWERLTFPMLRTAWRMGFEAGYGTGHVDGQRPSDSGPGDSR